MNEKLEKYPELYEYMKVADELGIQLQLFSQGTPQATGEDLQALLHQYAVVRQHLREAL